MTVPETAGYRLLACDLDGTLMGRDITVPARVRQAFSAVQARGIYVTLATGRGFPATLPFARLLNVTVPLICFQGGLIKHPVTGQVLYRAAMERTVVLRVIEVARSRNWPLVVYINDSTYVEEFRRARSFYDDLLGVGIKCVDDLARTISDSASDPAKFLVVADGTETNRIYTEMVKDFGAHMSIVQSHTLFVEGGPLGVNKGTALRRLAEHLNVPQQQVMAIGDQGNDAPMIAWAGMGIAMGSGSEETLAVADWVAPPLSDHGAALAIERFLLN